MKFDSFQKMKNVAYGEIFKSSLRRMSCLMTITQMRNEMQISEMIEIMNEQHVAQKYLVILIDTFNTAMVTKRTINFNVMIYHKGEGGPILSKSLLKAMHNYFFGRWKLGFDLIMSYPWKNECPRTYRSMPPASSRAFWEDTQHFIYWRYSLYHLQSYWRK